LPHRCAVRIAPRAPPADRRLAMSSHRAARNDVASPCISVCEILPASGLCAGCFRTLDEIAAWSVLDAPARRAVLAALPARRAAHEATLSSAVGAATGTASAGRSG
jgi:uncharacterized protein